MKPQRTLQRLTSGIAVALLLVTGAEIAHGQSATQPNEVRKQLNQAATPATISSSQSKTAPVTPSPAKVAQTKPAAVPVSPSVKPVQSTPAAKAPATSSAKPAVATAVPTKPGAPVVASKNAQAKPVAVPVPAKGQVAATSTKAVSGPAVAQPAAKPTAAAAAVAAPEVKLAAEHSNVARRDPFDPLINKEKEAASGPQAPLPAGKPGLVVASLRVDGIVRDPNGMIAVVSNPQMRVYFLHEGDNLYDGSVEHITMEGVSFHETGKDAFGKPVAREITKRLYPTPGEQQ